MTIIWKLISEKLNNFQNYYSANPGLNLGFSTTGSMVLLSHCPVLSTFFSQGSTFWFKIPNVKTHTNESPQYNCKVPSKVISRFYEWEPPKKPGVGSDLGDAPGVSQLESLTLRPCSHLRSTLLSIPDPNLLSWAEYRLHMNGRESCLLFLFCFSCCKYVRRNASLWKEIYSLRTLFESNNKKLLT